MAAEATQSKVRAFLEKRPRVSVGVLVAIYLVLGIVYSVSLPVFEAPDEMWHYSYVRYLVRKHRLPPWDVDSPVGQESSQPPLYYATAALATAWMDASSAEAFLEPNPHWGYPSAGTVNDNKNRFFHQTEGAEAFPWQDTALGVHIARLTNLLFGTLTVVFAYLLAREVLPGRPGVILSATAVVAFNPQFLFISSVVNNDAAISAFSTAALWLLVRGLRSGFTPHRLMMLGGAVGMATLSKASALSIVPVAALTIAIRTWIIDDQLREGGMRGSRGHPDDRFTQFILNCSLFVAPVAAVSGWWYVRNAILYGDPLGLQTHLATGWAHEESLSLAHIWTQLPNIELSYWAAFGWGNVHLAGVFYTVMRIALRLALAGLLTWVVGAWRAGERPGPRAWSLALLALWAVAVFVALLRWMQMVEAALGRLLFPAVGAIAVLMTWGLSRLASYASRVLPVAGRLRPRVANGTLAAFVAGLLCAAVAAPFAAIRPAYAQPALLSSEEIASRTDPADVRFGDAIQLVGFDRRPQSVSPGEEVVTTLCWKAIAPTTENYAYFVHFLGPNNVIVGARDTHPGLGRFPTAQWTPGIAFCDELRVPVVESAPTPAVYDIEIGWYEPESDARLPAYGPSDQGEDARIELVTVGRIEVVSEEQPGLEAPNPVEADLGDQVTLLGYGMTGGSQVVPGQAVDVILYWQAQSSLTANYTVFVHLGDPSSHPHAQDDGQPRGGTYPTSYWDVGQVVTDTHTVVVPNDLPPGRYPLVAGMYVLETGERLPAFDAEGERLHADVVPLRRVEVLPGESP